MFLTFLYQVSASFRHTPLHVVELIVNPWLKLFASYQTLEYRENNGKQILRFWSFFCSIIVGSMRPRSASVRVPYHMHGSEPQVKSSIESLVQNGVIAVRSCTLAANLPFHAFPSFPSFRRYCSFVSYQVDPLSAGCWLCLDLAA